MSNRSAPPLTLAAVLLFGAVGTATGQDGGFQPPINNERVEPSEPLNKTGFWSPENEYGHLRLIKVIGSGCVPPLRSVERDLPRLTVGGFSTYCAPALPRLADLTPLTQVQQLVSGSCCSMLVDACDAPAHPPEAHGTYVSDDYQGLIKRRTGRAEMSRVMTGGLGSYCAPVLPPLAPQPPHAPRPVVRQDRIQLAVATDVLTAPPHALPKSASIPLLGTWYRELPSLGAVASMTFTHDELKLCVAHSVDGHTLTVTITAHFTVAPDGLVYGAVTGTDVNVKSDPKASAQLANELADLTTVVQLLADTPFSCRTKMTSIGLTVSGMKCSSPDGKDASEMAQSLFGGSFKCAKDGKVPAPAPLKKTMTNVDVSAATGALIGIAGLPSSNLADMGPRIPLAREPDDAPPSTIERVGIDFSTNPPTMRLPVLLAPCPLQPGRPVGVGVSADGTKQLAQEAFGQLLQQSGVLPAPGGITLPSPRYLEYFPQYFAPDPAHPLPRELASQDAVEPVRRASATVPTGAAPAKAVGIGTWYRDVAGKQCVVKVTPDHLTLTVHDAQEVGGKVSTASLVITADYHLTRDGMTAVGLITGVDVNFEGEFPPEDSKPFFEMLGELQKVLEDKPLALTFRSYGDALVIGNVRMPQVSDRMEVQPASYMAGRYKTAGDTVPKPKPTKMPAEPRAQGRYVPPAGFAAEPVPAPVGAPEIAPTPLFSPPPLPSGSSSELLPPQQIPTPGFVPSGASDPLVSPPVKQSKPVPRMPQPVPPALSGRNGAPTEPIVL